MTSSKRVSKYRDRLEKSGLKRVEAEIPKSLHEEFKQIKPLLKSGFETKFKKNSAGDIIGVEIFLN